MTEPRGSQHVGISDKIALLIKMLEQLYPFGDRRKRFGLNGCCPSLPEAVPFKDGDGLAVFHVRARAISDMTEPRGSRHVGISDKIALLFKMLEQLYPFGDRQKRYT